MTHTKPDPEGPREEESLPFVLPAGVVPERLDKVLARLIPEHSRSRLQAWIEAGCVLVDGRPGQIRTRVGPGDYILVRPRPAPEDQAYVPEDIAFEVVAESPDWLVIDKPPGLVTHPGAGNWHGTLLNGLLFRYPELGQVARAGIVHRLDKDTSGLMVVARNATAQTHLVRQLQARSVHREYCALVHGYLPGAGRVEAAIGRDPRVPVRMSVLRPVAPRPALTAYRALAQGRVQGQAVSQVQCRLETGRTHQIRVHLASLGHPLLGDVLYGGQCLAGARRQMLHARALTFVDPGHGDERAFCRLPPTDYQQVCRAIEWQEGVRGLD